MNKYATLNLFKENILTLNLKSKEFEEQPVLLRRWQEQAEKVQVAVNKLSKEDKQWLEGEYKKWYGETIIPKYTKEQQELVDLGDSGAD